MIESILQPVSQDQVVNLAEGRLEPSERRRIVRSLLAQAARNQTTAGLDPYPGRPVPETAYDLALSRAFERACRLHKELSGKEEEDEMARGFEILVPVRSGYSPSLPSTHRT